MKPKELKFVMKKKIFCLNLACILCGVAFTLYNCGGTDEKAPQFSLDGVASISLPQYNIVSSFADEMGRNVYNLEWTSSLSKQDSVALFDSLSDFYADGEGRYFKCYAEGDSSICVNFNERGIAITKEETTMFQPLIDEINNKSGANIPKNVTPLLYKAYYGFQDSSYEIGFDKSCISDTTYTTIVEWAKTTDPSLDKPDAYVQVAEDTINRTPIIIISYNEH